jgi:hypothetical protein
MGAVTQWPDPKNQPVTIGLSNLLSSGDILIQGPFGLDRAFRIG